jgi:phenylpropionate dioxygenase-like ring-hydroxylating dioxygenase large terminal subunit
MNEELLYDLWYVACPSNALKPGKLQKFTLLGYQLILGRADDGSVFALRDFCPHRGIPLSYGTFDGKEIECCYHGWCFNTSGACTKIPALTAGDTTDVSRIKVAAFPARESEGAVWVYVPAKGAKAPEQLPPLPALPAAATDGFYHVDSPLFPCNIDHAVIGLMDPAHGPYVHRSWWWRSRKSMHEKAKQFAPRGMGFAMVAHKPSSNSRAYKILGGVPTTEIAFSLPGLRTEHIQVGNHYILLLTALTPIDANNTQLHQFVYSSIGWVRMLWPLLRPFGRAFLKQDLDIVIKQQEGLRTDHPSLMLLGDADQQALWYFRLKREYLQSQEQGRPFENKISEKLLRWRS